MKNKISIICLMIQIRLVYHDQKSVRNKSVDLRAMIDSFLSAGHFRYARRLYKGRRLAFSIEMKWKFIEQKVLQF